MLDIVIIAIGKIKEDFYHQAFQEYLKRLSPYTRIKIEELKAESFKDIADKVKSKEIEGEKILKILNNYPEAEVFILDERGTEFISIDLAARLKKNQTKKIVFVVGGTLGLSLAILNNQRFHRLSLSKMTLPHELARVVLAEQLYRSICINRGKDYHY